jgi:hypothetical protein
MKNWKSLLLLLLVFTAGLAVGVAATRLVVRRTVQQALVHPERAQAFVEHNLTRRLRLDHEQQIEVHSILSAARGQLVDLRKQFRPQAALVLSNADQKISAVLTPEQQARYARLKERGWPALGKLPAAP